MVYMRRSVAAGVNQSLLKCIYKLKSIYFIAFRTVLIFVWKQGGFLLQELSRSVTSFHNVTLIFLLTNDKNEALCQFCHEQTSDLIGSC